jgi:3-hydroxy-9,10-secoandrosta-1,3,5(10)-triene-9,17-dione monooxygenase reductase component
MRKSAMPKVESFDTREFRNTLGTFTTGVTVITTRSDTGEPAGLTANSFNSVSLDPPLVLWSIAKTSRAMEDFKKAEHWAVHVLADGQEALSNAFASKADDKFSGVEYTDGIAGLPLLPGCISIFQCQAEQAHDAGDHIILVGRVLEFERHERTPMAFVQGAYALTAKKTAADETGSTCPLCGSNDIKQNSPDLNGQGKGEQL